MSSGSRDRCVRASSLETVGARWLGKNCSVVRMEASASVERGETSGLTSLRMPGQPPYLN